MLRRPSGSPVDERPDEYFPDSDYTPTDGADDEGNNLRVKISKETDWGRKSKSPDTSPRNRNSAVLNRGSSEERSLEQATMLSASVKHVHGGQHQAKWRTSMRSPWSCSPLTLLTTAIAFLSLFAIIQSSMKLQLDPQGCLMSMMTPTYIKLSGFDTEHSRFATKYSLYLYREEGVDEYNSENIGLRGAPVLFIPGNAGSYKQVRSLSSEASRYFHGFLRHDEESIKSGTRSLDFFTVDFNEDLSAFHGQTVIDQAEYVNEAVAYILSLYHDSRRTMRDPQLPDPSSVILIGHSMGGIVARTVLVTPNYQSNSVNTIITMSTPHARAPVSFDADMVSLYQQINDHWRASYSQRWASNNPLWHTTLISIAGGGRDTTVPSDYASLASLVPESHGFTVFTSSIPDVWTSMDHLAITWADQIRKVIIKSLFDVIDVRRPTQTKARADRIKIFKKWLLTGLEDDAPKDLPTAEPGVLLAIEGGSKSPITSLSNITLRSLGAQDQPSAILLPLPQTSVVSKKLVLLTDQPMDKSGQFERIEILFCSTFPLPANQASAVLPDQIDLSGGSPSAMRLACKRAAGDGIRLPASTRNSKDAFDQVSPFTFLQYELSLLKAHQFIAIVDKSTEISSGWLFTEITDGADSVEPGIGLAGLLTRGLHLELPAARPLVTDIRVPALHSSLLAYKLRIRHQGCGDERELFTPLLRQHIDAPYESKYFVNFKQGDINLHGVAPFMPPSLSGEDGSRGIGFQIWSDPTCESSLEFQLHADLVGSLGKLVVRYRTVFAAFPLLIVAMVLRKQFRVYDSTGVFITFSDSLNQSLKIALPVLLLSLTFFATAFTTARSAGASSGSSTPLNGTSINYAQNDLLLGSQDTFFWFLVPLAGLISIGVCVALNYLVMALLQVFSLLFAVLSRRHTHAKSDTRQSQPQIPISSSPRRRVINTFLLLFLVATIIPYPFAYVVACIVQLATCTRALRNARDTRSVEQHNFFNYTYSILILMLWILPINLPVLVVWVHNLAVHWLTPFSSHHNVLSIMPFILLVETVTSGMMIPRVTTHLRWATNLLFFVLALYAAVFGMTYAYRLHHITNIVALWLVILHFSHNPGFSIGGIKTMLETDADLDTTDVKKMP